MTESVTDRLRLLRDLPWQMTFGERAALEGIVSQLRPKLAIEVGTARGASLASLIRHCDEVHSFDLTEPNGDLGAQEGVTLHTGDSHELLAAVLAEFAADGRSVDFALVDGDHTAAGVRADIEALLDSQAVVDCVILAHDAANGIVREGLEAVRYELRSKVAYVDLDFISGYAFRKSPFGGEIWGGLGLILVRDHGTAYVEGTAPRQDARFSSFELLSEGWQRYAARQGFVARLEGLADPQARTTAALERRLFDEHERRQACEGELDRARSHAADMERTLSWRLTKPLRALRGRRRG